MRGFNRFWKQLVLWLAQQQDDTNQLWINLDKCRINAGAAEVLGFKFGLRDSKGNELPQATFAAEVIGPNQQKFKVLSLKEDQHQRGAFQEAKESGEYQLVISGKGTGRDGQPVQVDGAARAVPGRQR